MDEVREIRDFKILKFLDRFRGLFEKSGVNYAIMRKLLQVMLIIDGRRPVTIMGKRSKNKTGDSSLVKNYMISYGILGLFIAIFVFAPFSMFYKMNMVFGMTIFMVMTTMISDFSAILLDVKDKIILVPRPIDAKTMNAAKTLRILIYLIVLTMAIAGPTLIAGTTKYGILFFIMFFIQLMLVSVFVIFLTSILYFFILRFFDGEKLKDVINYFQIMLSIAMTIGYQLMGRAFDVFQTRATFVPRWWSYLIPSMWFAAPYSIFMEGNSQNIYIALSIPGIIVPVLLFAIYNIKISGYFEKNLQKLSGTNEKKAVFLEKKGRLQKRIADILCPDRQENIFFRFTHNMISNERQLKLKLYPSLAYAVVFPFVFMFNSFERGRSFGENLAGLAGSKNYLNIYIALIFLSGLFIVIYSSERYKGAWIYRVLPLESPGPVYRGAVKSFISRYIIPVFLFICFIFFMLYGARLIPHLVIMLINLLILGIISFDFSKKELPFSMEFMDQQKSGTGCLMYIILAAYSGISAVLDILFSGIKYGLLIYGVIAAAVLTIIWNYSFRLKWSDIYRSES